MISFSHTAAIPPPLTRDSSSPARPSSSPACYSLSPARYSSSHDVPMVNLSPLFMMPPPKVSVPFPSFPIPRSAALVSTPPPPVCLLCRYPSGSLSTCYAAPLLLCLLAGTPLYKMLYYCCVYVQMLNAEINFTSHQLAINVVFMFALLCIIYRYIYYVYVLKYI